MSDERFRRWRLILGGEGQAELGDRDRRIDQALSMLYDRPETTERTGRRRGGLGRSAPTVSRWLGDIREFFPSQVVRVMQKDALDRFGLGQMLLEPELLASIEPDVHLVAELISLGGVIPEKARATARDVVGKVVAEILRRLEQKTTAAVRGALDRSRRSRRPRPAEIDWARTIEANLRHYQPGLGTIVPERLVGHGRRSRRSNLEDVILCVDQSGSMATSVIYASIFAAVLASLPALSTRMVAFDTAVVDLSEHLADPVELLFGIQLGGGTDINQAIGYCETLVRRPTETHLILISDLEEGGDGAAMLARVERLVRLGVQVIVLLALSDDGKPSYDVQNAAAMAGMGIPVFGCTPDLLPDLLATALRRGDVGAWAAANDLVVSRPGILE